MPDSGKLTDFDDAILAVLYHSASSSLTYGEIRKALKKKGYDVSEKEVETAVQQLRNRGYLSTKIDYI
jgi:repressor of nif and glnA expression